MTGSGSESFTSKSVDHELIPRGPEVEMAVRLALRRSREAAALRLCSDSQRRESIASAQPVLGSGVAASPEAVRSVWRPHAVADAQPLLWRAEDAPWATADANKAACLPFEAAGVGGGGDLAAVDVKEAESHSLAPRRVHQCGRCNRVVVDAGSSQEGYVIDLTSIGTVRVTGSDEEE